jgi:hypothetical protein
MVDNMALSILIRIIGVILLVVAGRFGVKSWHQILPLRQRAIVLFIALIAGAVGFSCALAGDLPLAAFVTLGMTPLALVTVLRLYFAERKILTKLRMYKEKFRQAKKEGDEDEMIDNHARAASYRWHLPRVKEAQDEDLEDWW